MINGVLQGYLLTQIENKTDETADNTADAFSCRWPVGEPVKADMLEAANSVSSQQRLQLKKDADENLLLSHAIFLNNQFWGVVVFRLTPRSPSAVKGAVRLLKWGDAWLQYTLFRNRNDLGATPDEAIQHAPSEQTFEAGFAILQKVSQESSLSEAAITLVNHVASLLGAERVSLGLFQKNKVVVQAVSFAAHFDSRSPAIIAVSNAMHEAVKRKTNISYSPALNEEERKKYPAHKTLQNGPQDHIETLLLTSQQHIAVLQIEGRGDDSFSPASLNMLFPVLPQLGAIFSFHQRLNESTRSKLRTKFTAAWQGKHRLLVRSAVTAFALLVIALFFPSEYRISSPVEVYGNQKHLVVADHDGYLSQVLARPGDKVAAEQVLATMDDEDIRLRRRKLVSEAQQHRYAYNTAMANGERSKAAIASAQVEQAQIQLSLVEQELLRAQLKSPIDGLIVSQDISQSVGAPVTQGERLFEVVSESDYHLSLLIDERDIGFIRAGMKGTARLTSLPGDTIPFTILRITPLAESADGRTFFRVEANLTETHAALIPGMSGNAKVNVGRFSRAWALSRRMVEWLHLTFWW